MSKQWQCSKCTLNNDFNALRCDACNHRRPRTVALINNSRIINGTTSFNHNKRKSHNISENNNNNNNNKRRRLSERNISYKLPKNKWNMTKKLQTYELNIQRRETRIQYRKLADDTVENRADIDQQFINKLEKQNDIYDKVIHPHEAYMDIEQSKTMSIILKEQTQTLVNQNFTITPNDYIRSLCTEFQINNYNNNNNNNDELKCINWSAVGKQFAEWYLTIPSITFMNGALQQSIDIQEKRKKPIRKKQIFISTKPVVQPKKVIKQNIFYKTETKSRVQHLRKVLKRKCVINPFQFLINPVSYSQTIENLFDLSFIMKEGDAQINIDNNTKQPVLSFISKAENTRRLNNNGNDRKNGQCIVKFNPSDFYNLINVYGIKEPQIERADEVSESESESESECESARES